MIKKSLPLLLIIISMGCKNISGPGEGNSGGGSGGGNSGGGSDTTQWVLLAEGTFTSYEWEINGDTICDSIAPNWPRDAYDDPVGSRIPMNDTVRPGDMLRAFGRYEGGNDYVFGLAFAGDTAITGYQELALAVIPDTLSFPGDTASYTMPNGQTRPLIGLIVVAALGNGDLVCRPNSVDSARIYFRLEKRK